MGKLWTKEELVKFWNISGTYSGYCEYFKFVTWSAMYNDLRCYKISIVGTAFTSVS